MSLAGDKDPNWESHVKEMCSHSLINANSWVLRLLDSSIGVRQMLVRVLSLYPDVKHA